MILQSQRPALERNYIWSTVDYFEVGPRREITLFMKLWKENGSPATIAPVRFGGVENLEEVQAFFESVAAETAKLSPNAIEPIGKFDYAQEYNSKINEIYFRVVFDRSDEAIIIRCQNVTEKETFSGLED